MLLLELNINKYKKAWVNIFFLKSETLKDLSVYQSFTFRLQSY